MHLSTVLLAALVSTFTLAIPLDVDYNETSVLYPQVSEDGTPELPEFFGEDTTPFPDEPETTPTVLSQPKAREFKDKCTNGCCPERRFHFPRRSQYELGYKQFCRNWVPKGKKTVIQKKVPLVVTYHLKGNDNRPIKWIYKVNMEPRHSQRDSGDYSFDLSHEVCNKKFASILEGAVGPMPTANCWLWGEELVMGGKIFDTFGMPETAMGQATFETRQRLDDKPKAQY